MIDKLLTDIASQLPDTVPFVGPETQERASGKLFKARLGANENGFGPSPLAITAMADSASEIWKYPDPESYDLRTALAETHDVAMENIVIGCGIDGLLCDLIRLTVGPGIPVVTSQGAYPTFNYHVAGFGGELHQVPFSGDFEDPIALIDKAKEVGARLIYFSNPNNPMGSWHDAETVAKLINNVPEGCLLVLDEAYVEFAPDGTAPAIDTGDSRVIRMRTFSKAYGMAGARVGYAIGNAALISAFNKVRNHFTMNKSAQIGALAALKDQDYLQTVLEKTRLARQAICDIAKDNGLAPLPSATNFVTMDCGADGDLAKALVQELARLGVFIRMPFVAPQNRCIRVSVGPEEEIDIFAKALPEALKAAQDRI